MHIIFDEVLIFTCLAFKIALNFPFPGILKYFSFFTFPVCVCASVYMFACVCAKLMLGTILHHSSTFYNMAGSLSQTQAQANLTSLTS